MISDPQSSDARAAHAASAGAELARGRRRYQRRSWHAAHESLTRADASSSLEREDLERLATASYLVGRNDDYSRALERAHHGHLEAGDRKRAARCAFWLGLQAVFQGEMGPASGWFSRAQRLVDQEEHDCVEQGYLQLPIVEQQLAGGDLRAAFAAATTAAEIGERFDEPDLIALARHLQGRVRVRQQQIEDGLALLDEAMVAVKMDELSPIVTGLIYCSVLECCLEVYEVSRARQWTAALAQWWEEQPEMVAFTGRCLLFRSEILQIRGAWGEALQEAQRARERMVRRNGRHVAAAFYRQAEIHRLRGEIAAAEEAYQNANRLGMEPQPGLALLRVAQGRAEAATDAIRGTLNAISRPLQRARLLPALVECLVAVGDTGDAGAACRELEQIAAQLGTAVLHAQAAQARGSIELAEGNDQAALGALRSALRLWDEIDAPYQSARVRVLIALVYRALGNDEGAGLELDAARTRMQDLGAAPDVAYIDSVAAPSSSAGDHEVMLTRRELEVLRLVATGKTSKAIAADLYVSVKTIDRHVSNIFTKLGVPSRTAATAYAIRHKII